MRVVSLASGSSGNSYVVVQGTTALLVDAGLSCAATAKAVREIGLEPESITAMLLTHDHIDHIRGARLLSKKFGIPILATEKVIVGASLHETNWEPFRAWSETSIGPFKVTSFPLPHDASETVGFLIENEETSVCFATDLGHAPEHLGYHLSGADLVVLEANHDLEMLRLGPYPQYLKARILGARGHLSNDACADLLEKHCGSPGQTIWLAHLSEINNSPRHALQAVCSRLADSRLASTLTVEAVPKRNQLTWTAVEKRTSADTFQPSGTGEGTALSRQTAP